LCAFFCGGGGRRVCHLTLSVAKQNKNQKQKNTHTQNRLNGTKLRTAFTGVKAAGLYATVGLHSKGEAVEVNFGGGGAAKPFMYDLDAALAEEREARAAAVARCVLLCCVVCVWGGGSM
jgi:hypothetical protein